MSSSYFTTLSHYNAWANRRLYQACETLSETEYMRERGSSFGSLHATLNHILVSDRIWVARIEGRTPPNLKLDQILYGDLIGLKMARVAATIAAGGEMPQGRWVMDSSNSRVAQPREIVTPDLAAQAHARVGR